MVSLGFSDLNEDEALLVAIYRDWARRDDAKEMVEGVVADALAGDALGGALGAVFAVYRENAPDVIDPRGLGDLLSDHEERLLDTLSRLARTAYPGKDIIPHVLLAVRPSSEIQRSGRDELIYKANIGLWSVAPGV